MQTIILDKPFHFSLTHTAPPQHLQPGEALVRVQCVGVCGTDLHAYRGRQPFFSYPRILGHELGVEVVDLMPPQMSTANSSSKPFIQTGDHCSVEPYLNCGHCIACRRGKTNCCTSLQVLGVHIDGGMREFIVVPVHKLHKSATLSYEQLALVETLGIGAHAVDRAALQTDEWVLVIGAGPIGLSVIQFAQLHTRNIIVLDMSAQRRNFCAQQLGIAHVIDATPEALPAIASITKNDLPTVVFDATGNVQSMNSAFQFVAHGGKLVFVGLVQADVTFNDPFFHRRELTLLASRNAPSQEFPRIIQLVESGHIDTRPWVTHRVAAAAMPTQFDQWQKPDSGLIKAVVQF
jgi:2-desacetyl-2-hydroxyethyl bacteriochlorophyllide A dehydrogenase